MDRGFASGSEERQAVLDGIRQTVDDRDTFLSYFRDALEHHAADVYKALGEFVTLGAVSQLIKENAPKVSAWIAQTSRGYTIGNACKQFITHAIRQSEAMTDKSEVELSRALEKVIRVLREAAAEGKSGEEMIRLMGHVSKAAEMEAMAELRGSKQRFESAVKVQAHSLADTCDMAIENAILRMQNAMQNAQGSR